MNVHFNGNEKALFEEVLREAEQLRARQREYFEVESQKVAFYRSDKLLRMLTLCAELAWSASHTTTDTLGNFFDSDLDGLKKMLPLDALIAVAFPPPGNNAFKNFPFAQAVCVRLIHAMYKKNSGLGDLIRNGFEEHLRNAISHEYQSVDDRANKNMLTLRALQLWGYIVRASSFRTGSLFIAENRKSRLQLLEPLMNVLENLNVQDQKVQDQKGSKLLEASTQHVKSTKELNQEHTEIVTKCRVEACHCLAFLVNRANELDIPISSIQQNRGKNNSTSVHERLINVMSGKYNSLGEAAFGLLCKWRTNPNTQVGYSREDRHRLEADVCHWIDQLTLVAEAMPVWVQQLLNVTREYREPDRGDSSISSYRDDSTHITAADSQKEKYFGKLMQFIENRLQKIKQFDKKLRVLHDHAAIKVAEMLLVMPTHNFKAEFKLEYRQRVCKSVYMLLLDIYKSNPAIQTHVLEPVMKTLLNELLDPAKTQDPLRACLEVSAMFQNNANLYQYMPGTGRLLDKAKQLLDVYKEQEETYGGERAKDIILKLIDVATSCNGRTITQDLPLATKIFQDHYREDSTNVIDELIRQRRTIDSSQQHMSPSKDGTTNIKLLLRVAGNCGNHETLQELLDLDASAGNENRDQENAWVALTIAMLKGGYEYLASQHGLLNFLEGFYRRNNGKENIHTQEMCNLLNQVLVKIHKLVPKKSLGNIHQDIRDFVFQAALPGLRILQNCQKKDTEVRKEDADGKRTSKDNSGKGTERVQILLEKWLVTIKSWQEDESWSPTNIEKNILKEVLQLCHGWIQKFPAGSKNQEWPEGKCQILLRQEMQEIQKMHLIDLSGIFIRMLEDPKNDKRRCKAVIALVKLLDVQSYSNEETVANCAQALKIFQNMVKFVDTKNSHCKVCSNAKNRSKDDKHECHNNNAWFQDLGIEALKKRQNRIADHNLVPALVNIMARNKHKILRTEALLVAIDLLYEGNRKVQDLFMEHFRQELEHEFFLYLQKMIQGAIKILLNSKFMNAEKWADLTDEQQHDIAPKVREHLFGACCVS